MNDYARSDVSLANWREAPFSRWSFQNLSELVPVALVKAASEPESQPTQPGLIGGVSVRHPVHGQMTLARHLERSHADVFVVMRDGVVLDEWVAPHANALAPHVVFSISKSVTGMVAGIAVSDGALDPDAPVSRYVDVAAGSAYADATVRNLLDMTVSLDFEEDYTDVDGPFGRYRRAMLWNPARPDAPAENLRDVLAVLPRKAGPHGKVFFYASPDTDLMGLVLEAATGMRFPAYLAERLWTPMGARGAAYVTVDRAGSSRAAGGICVTARDLARFGQLVLDGGRTKEGRQVIPAAWIADMHENGDRQAWVDGSFAASFPDGRYRSFWYETGDAHRSFCAIGIHGQWLWVDPVTRAVVVRFSSRPEASDDALSMIESDILGQVGRSV